VRSSLFDWCSFAIVGAKQFGIKAFTVKEPLQRDVAYLGTVVGHGYPHDVIHIAGAVLVKGCSGRSHGDVLVTVYVIVVVIVQVPREPGVPAP